MTYDMAYLRHRFVPSSSLLGGRTYSLETLRAAIAAHDVGEFAASKPLVHKILTDPDVLAAHRQRVETPVGLPIRVDASEYQAGRGRAEAARAEVEAMFRPDSPTCPPSMSKDCIAWMVWLGVKVAQNVWIPRADGSRVDIVLEPVPMDQVYWDGSRKTLMVMTWEGAVPVTHGDGKWTVFWPDGPESWLWGVVRAAAEPFYDRALGRRWRSLEGQAHGSKMPVAECPAGVSVDSPEGKAMGDVVKAIVDGRRVGATLPNGGKLAALDFKGDGSSIHAAIIDGNRGSLVRALLGQDGTSQNSGGTYTKALALNDVRFSLVEGDALIEMTAHATGWIRPWAEINFGDARFAPTVRRLIPDLEEDARRAGMGAAREAHASALKAYRDAGAEVTQALSDQVAREQGLPQPYPLVAKPPPSLPQPPPAV